MSKRSLGIALLLAVLLGIPTASAASAPLSTGLTDSAFSDPAWLDRAVGSDAQTVVLFATWDSIAATRPAQPADPGDPAYDFSSLDSLVRAASARHLRVILGSTRAPEWAEGAGRPASAAPGTWRPDARAFGQFATALARRYSGSFTPAGAGHALPRVSEWQAWTEPNLTEDLAPQWVRVHGHFAATSPGIYRGLLNAFYAGVKGVSSHNLVITGGTAPYGDPFAGGQRIAPALFIRDLLCVGGHPLRGLSCPDPAHFDVLDHHPYSIGSPGFRALQPDDVSIPDLVKLSGPLRLAERTGRALPRERHRLWVTEVSWDSSPPDPHGVPIQTQARWLEETFFRLWHERVDTVIWFLIRDQAPIPNYAETYQSGLYYRNGRPKPAAQAFRFPFVTERLAHGRLELWGRSPRSGRLVVERRSHGRWVSATAWRVRGNAVFDRVLRMPSGTLRAVVGRDSSLSYG